MLFHHECPGQKYSKLLILESEAGKILYYILLYHVRYFTKLNYIYKIKS